jgi:hypothetical protein
MMLVTLFPSAVTVVGNGTSPAAAAGGVTKGTVAVCWSTTPSVVSVAVKTTVSTERSETAKVTTPPFVSEIALLGLIFA